MNVFKQLFTLLIVLLYLFWVILRPMKSYMMNHQISLTLSLLAAWFCVHFQTKKSKFHPKVDKSIFIGYSLTQKAYKTYNPTTNSIVFSRDVTFQEHHSPYHSTTPFSTFYLPTHTPIPCYDDLYLSPTLFPIPSPIDTPYTPSPIHVSTPPLSSHNTPSHSCPISSTLPNFSESSTSLILIHPLLFLIYP